MSLKCFKYDICLIWFHTVIMFEIFFDFEQYLYSKKTQIKNVVIRLVAFTASDFHNFIFCYKNIHTRYRRISMSKFVSFAMPKKNVAECFNIRWVTGGPFCVFGILIYCYIKKINLLHILRLFCPTKYIFCSTHRT